MAKMFLKNRILTHKIESILGQIEIFGMKIIGYFLKLFWRKNSNPKGLSKLNFCAKQF